MVWSSLAQAIALYMGANKEGHITPGSRLGKMGGRASLLHTLYSGSTAPTKLKTLVQHQGAAPRTPPHGQLSREGLCTHHSWLRSHGCIAVGARSLAPCTACPLCLRAAFIWTSSRPRMLRNVPHVVTGPVALFRSTAILAWPRQLHFLA